MKLNSLQDLYLSELKDLYDAEHRIIKALPKMAEAASSPDLRNAFNEHLGADSKSSEPVGADIPDAGRTSQG